MHRNEHRARPRGLADLLLPYALIEDGVLLQQDGSLLAAWSYRGPDMMSAAAAEMDALSARLNHVLRLGSGWMASATRSDHAHPVIPSRVHFPIPLRASSMTSVVSSSWRKALTSRATTS